MAATITFFVTFRKEAAESYRVLSSFQGKGALELVKTLLKLSSPLTIANGRLSVTGVEPLLTISFPC